MELATETPEVREPTRRERLQGPLITGALVGGLTLALRLRDPHESGSWGLCPFSALTGLYCPGCGGLRAVNDLTHGDVWGAASSNLVFVVLVPVLVVLWLRWTGRAWAGGSPATGTARPGVRVGVWVTALAVVLVVFAVLRNLPMGSWLAP